MGNRVIAIFTILFFSVASYAQDECKARMKMSDDGKRPIAIFDLLDYEKYSNRREYVGKIAHINYDDDTGANIEGFALELDNGIRESVDLTYSDCLYSMSPMEIQWIPYLIRKGLRVRVSALLQGSGGYISAKDIILMNTPKKIIRKQNNTKKAARKKK